jgi:hypothetical protein
VNFGPSPDELRGLIAEGEAAALERLKAELRSLTPERRLELFAEFCLDCGGEDPRCQCGNDD